MGHPAAARARRRGHPGARGRRGVCARGLPRPGAARRRCPRRSGPCCSGTRARAGAPPCAITSPTRPAPAGSRRSSSSRATTCARSCSMRWRAARTPSRPPAAMAPRRSSRRSPPSAAWRSSASRRGPATTSRSTSAWTARRRRRARRVHRRRRAASRRRRRSTAAPSSTTCRSASTASRSRHAYRDAKLRTLLDTAGRAQDFDLEWTGPARAPPSRRHRRAGLQQPLSPRCHGRRVPGLASTRACSASPSSALPAQIGERYRPLLRRPWRQWSAPEFEVRADRPVPTGIDGESILLDPPLSFTVRPGALRVRISSAASGRVAVGRTPARVVDMARTLARLAAGRQPSALAPQAS